jgi:hypothetical protein
VHSLTDEGAVTNDRAAGVQSPALVRVLFLLSVAALPWGALVRLSQVHPNAEWSDPIIALAVVGGLIAHRSCWRLTRIEGWHLALVAYMAAAVTSFAASSAHDRVGLAKLGGMAMLGGWAVVAGVVCRDQRVRHGLAVVACVSVAGLAMALATTVVVLPRPMWLARMVGPFGDLVPGHYVRFQGGFTHPGQLGSFLLLAWAVVGLRGSSLPGWVRRGARALALILLISTFSRAILAMVVLLANTSRQPRLRCLRGAVTGVVVSLIAVLSLLNLRLDPSRPWAAHWGRQVPPRRLALVSSLRSVASQPLAGRGPESHPGNVNGTPMDAHCTPVNVAATLGLPALGALAIMVALVWRQRSRPTDWLLWGALLALGIDGLAQDVEDFRHVWLAIGLAAADGQEVGKSNAAGGKAAVPSRAVSPEP